MFLMLIAFVFVTTLVFGVLIWKQTIKVEKRALEAKRRQEEYQRQLEIAKEAELEIQRAEEKLRLEEEDAPVLADSSVDNAGLSEA